jgi:hypothetical protein
MLEVTMPRYKMTWLGFFVVAVPLLGQHATVQAQRTPSDAEGHACVTHGEQFSDSYGYVHQKWHNGCGAQVMVDLYGERGGGHGAYIDPGETADITCYNRGENACGGFARYTIK